MEESVPDKIYITIDLPNHKYNIIIIHDVTGQFVTSDTHTHYS